MYLKPILSHILFSFVDEVDNKGQFVKTTEWGLVIPGHFDDSAKKPRWAIVASRGDDCSDDIQVGDEILIKPLKWTTSFKFEGDRLWRTDDSQVIAVRRLGELIIRDKNIVFERIEYKRALSTSIEVSASVFEETARGRVLMAGPTVVSELKKDIILYYVDKNFFNEFDHAGQKLWYIDEDEVLFYEPQE